MEFFEKDFIWRPIAAVLIIATAFVGHLVADNMAKSDYISPMNQLAQDMAQNTGDWLSSNLELGKTLANDARLKKVYAEGAKWRINGATLRRVIYEFSYLNSVDSVYAINPHRKPNVVKSSTAPDLPPAIFSLFRTNGGDPAAQGAAMVNVEGEPKFLVMHTMYDDIGAVAGYVAFIKPLAPAVSSLQVPVFKDVQGYEVGIYRRQGNTMASGLHNINDPSTIRTIDVNQTDLPIFTRQTAYGEFTYLNEPIIGATANITGFPDWVVAGHIALDVIQEGNQILKWVLKTLAVLGLAALLLIPGKNGQYAKLLRKRKEDKQAATERAGLPLENLRPSDLRKMDTAEGLPALSDLENKEEDIEVPILNKMPPPPPIQKPMGEGAGKAFDRPDLETTKKKKGPSIVVARNKNLGADPEVKEKKKKDQELSENIITYIIRQCLTEKRIKLLYQPIFDAQTNQVSMYEVYLRLLDEDGTILPPGQFMPVAEKHNLMDEIDACVIDVVVEKHFSSGEANVPAPLSVNLSGSSFDSIGYMGKIIDYVSDGIVSPGLMSFELQSKEMIGDKKALRFIRECRELGLRFGIDYFGGGPQTLHAAKNLKFDFAKINAFRYKDLAKDKAQQKELATLAATAKKVDLPLVLERIESPLAAKFATKLGINYLQGYHLGEPAEKFLSAPATPPSERLKEAEKQPEQSAEQQPSEEQLEQAPPPEGQAAPAEDASTAP